VGLRTSLTSLPTWPVIREAQHHVVIRHCRGLVVESSDWTSSSPPRTSSCKGGGWSLCTMWRSSSSSSLTEHHHRTSLLRPSSLSVVYVKRWCKWTPLLYSSHPPLNVKPTLVPAGDWEHHSGECAPPHTAVRHRVPVSRQAGHAGPCEPNRPAGPFRELGRTMGHGLRSGVAS
jgi:hypothetical protein